MVDDSHSSTASISRNNLETADRIQLPKWVVLERHEHFNSKEEERRAPPQMMGSLF